MKEDPGTSTLIMKGEHGQEVPYDPGQVTAILGTTCPPLLPPPPGHSGQNTLPPPFRRHTPPLVPVPLEDSLGESTLRPRAQDQRFDRLEARVHGLDIKLDEKVEMIQDWFVHISTQVHTEVPAELVNSLLS